MVVPCWRTRSRGYTVAPNVRSPYQNPPIEEALVELSFDGGLSWAESEEPLLAAFAPMFSGPKRPLSTYQVHADWREGNLRTDHQSAFSRWLLPSAEGTRLVGLGPGVLSVHVLRPYPGWAAFRPAIDEAFRMYQGVARPGALRMLAVRYIDQILLPANADVRGYFKALPAALPSQPRALEAFQSTTETLDPDTGVRAKLTLLSGPRTNDGRQVVVYDLELTHRFTTAVSPDGWTEVVELLHERQKAMFEESIEDSTRSLFQ
jgi:uncharacterized protein (TIGR04255 family)